MKLLCTKVTDSEEVWYMIPTFELNIHILLQSVLAVDKFELPAIVPLKSRATCHIPIKFCTVKLWWKISSKV